ncbi:MAG TPA: hypothetical protein VFD92_13185 [Candidatus Binatia bacterium]|nr:hypothetical protein [Candidatus Binatia bacterium]
MRGIVTIVAVAVIAAASASVSYADDRLRCDTVKSAAVSRLFKDLIQCNHKAQFDLSFDLTTCRDKAYNRCTTAITRADVSFGNACFYTANFQVCIDTLTAANDIYPGI